MTRTQSIAEAIAWLEQEAMRIVPGCARRMHDGKTGYAPQVETYYEAFWLREYAYVLAGVPNAFSEHAARHALRLFVRSMRADGACVDCVLFDGTPIYQPGFGTMGRNPVADGSQFLVDVAWHTHRKLGNPALVGEIAGDLVKAMACVPRAAESGLVWIDPNEEWDRASYGFTDTVRKQGADLFCSLLFVQACRQLADLLRVAGRDEALVGRWRREGVRVAEHIADRFWDGRTGLYRAATVRCREHDIWESAFAFFLQVAPPRHPQAVAAYFQDHYREIVHRGHIRHLPGGVYWDATECRWMASVAKPDAQQNGGYWPTPAGWFVYTRDLVDPQLADRTVFDLVDHFKEHGVCEWIFKDDCRHPGYPAHAALPLVGFRTLVERRGGK